MLQYSEDAEEHEQILLQLELSQLAITPLEHDSQDRESLNLSPMHTKWTNSQSTHYQTHHSHLFSQTPTRNQWISHKKNSQPGSSSPINKYKRNYYNNALIPTTSSVHLIENVESPRKVVDFKGLKLQQGQSSPQRSSFRLRLIKSNLNRSYVTTSISEPKPEITAQAFCALFTDTNQLLLSQNHHTKKQIASLTKIMTAYTVLNICQDYNIKVREHFIPIHNRASYMQGTSANLRSGEEILIIDLLYGLLLPSGNDAGIALAQYFGKFLSFKYAKDNLSNDHYDCNIQKFNQCRNFYDSQYERESIKLFVFQMNKYAHELGLKDTQFVNPTGLTNVDNYSTAGDMALLTSICLKNQLLRLIFRKKVHKCDVKNDKLGYNREVLWKNTNKHLYKIKECIGVKTGITPGAGPCLSSAYRIGNRQIVVIVLNCASLDERYSDAQKVYKWCRRRFNAHN